MSYNFYWSSSRALVPLGPSLALQKSNQWHRAWATSEFLNTMHSLIHSIHVLAVLTGSPHICRKGVLQVRVQVLWLFGWTPVPVPARVPISVYFFEKKNITMLQQATQKTLRMHCSAADCRDSPSDWL